MVRSLSASNKKLEAADKMRQDFLRNISHELATPLTPVVGYLDLLEDGELGPLTGLQKQVVRAMSEQVNRLRRTIDNLVDVSVLEAAGMHFYSQSYDAAQAVREMVGEFESMHNVVIAQHYESVTLVGDRDKVQRAVRHVLDNARKFGSGAVQNGIAVEVIARDGHAIIAIADDGIGIDPDIAQQASEAFFQGDGTVTRGHGGAGLGLTFAANVARAQGGTLMLERAAGRSVAGQTLNGTLATLRLAISAGR